MGFLRKTNPHPYASEGALVNAIERLYANIRFLDVDGSITSLTVTSAVSGEGKSTVSLALASAMGRSGKRALLMECDLRRRSLADMLDMQTEAGIFAVLSGKMRLVETIQPTEVPNLWFLDVEPDVRSPADTLGSASFARMLASLERLFDYVVIDTPPLLAFADASIVAARTDASILVARENRVRRKELARARAQLEKSGARVLGAVMNMCSNDTSEHYYRSHYEKTAKR